MKSLWIVLGVVGFIIVVLLFAGGSYISAKNTLVQKNEAVNQALFAGQRRAAAPSRPDSEPCRFGEGLCQRRVHRPDQHRQRPRRPITSAPDRASNIAANSKLDVALGPFFRLQEQYPNLKGNEQFMRLTDELAGTENRIAVERQRYNKALEDYNVYVRQFPNSIWANIAGFHYRDEYFKGNPENSEAPKVDFSK